MAAGEYGSGLVFNVSPLNVITQGPTSTPSLQNIIEFISK